MQNDQTYSEIINQIRTKDDFNLLVNELDAIEETLSEVKPKDLSGEVRYEVLSFFNNYVGEKKEDVLKQIRAELNAFRFVELTLAMDPTENLIDELVLFLRQKIDQKIAIDIKVDHLIMGGALVAFEGKFFDGSLAKNLEEKLKNYA